MKTLSVPVYIKETSGLTRYNDPVRVGVPFPMGLVHDLSHLFIRDAAGQSGPFQCRCLSKWPDGSVKWALVDFFASVDGKSETTYYIEKTEDSNDETQTGLDHIHIEQRKQSHLIDTGAATFEISPKSAFPFHTVAVNGFQLLSSRGSEILLIGQNGKFHRLEIESTLLEETGPVRCTFYAQGRFFARDKKTTARFESRITFYKGLSLVSLDIQIHNPRAALHPGGLWDLGDPGSIYFKGLSLVFYGAESTDSVEWQVTPGDSLYCSRQTNWSLYQDSSGGENWNSPNHVDRNGNLSVSFCGYKVTGGDDTACKKRGSRANPFVRINMSRGWIAGAVKEFWQNFPKALKVSANQLEIGIFPAECPSAFELQGGEKKRHTLFLEFGKNQGPCTVPHLLSPLKVILSPDWIKSTQAIAHFSSFAEDPNVDYLEYVKHVVKGPHSFFKKREIIDEYGWRNFGDVYADHEAIHARDKKKFISHYNNQFDFIYGAGVHFLRSGDYRWYELMTQYARHVVDIDIYHTDEDRQAYNHGLFWHTDHYRSAGRSTHRTFTRDGLTKKQASQSGGGPCNEHNYTSGLLLYYYLTGDLFVKEAVIELAQWVLDMDDGTKSIWAIIDQGPTGLASQTVSTDYHRPGRGAGNSINALMDAYSLTGSRYYLSKAEELIQRCIHPLDDIDQLHLDEPEYRWSYLVFLQVLGKYLDLKAELQETDWYFFYARDSLLHYAQWMLEHEVPYKEVLHKVKIPTETWPAQDVRKACVLNYAWEYGPPGSRGPFKKKARFFFDRCLTDLLSFETAHLTRPMVILTVYGFMQAYFDLGGADSPRYLTHNYEFGNPGLFIPQRARLKDSLKREIKVTLGVLRHLARSKFYSATRALLTK